MSWYKSQHTSTSLDMDISGYRDERINSREDYQTKPVTNRARMVIRERTVKIMGAASIDKHSTIIGSNTTERSNTS
jgi:hypothetical protein